LNKFLKKIRSDYIKATGKKRSFVGIRAQGVGEIKAAEHRSWRRGRRELGRSVGDKGGQRRRSRCLQARGWHEGEIKAVETRGRHGF